MADREDRVVLGVGVGIDVEWLAALRALGARIETCAALGDVARDCDPVLVVTRGNVAAVRGRWYSVPLLALVADDIEGPDAVRDGADHVLLESSAQPLLCAVYLAACRDAERRRLLRAYEVALDIVSDSVEVSDHDARLLYVNGAFMKATGYDRVDAIGRTPGSLLRTSMHGPAFYSAMTDAVFRKERWTGALLGRRKDGDLVAQVATVAPVFENGRPIHHVVAIKQSAPTTGTFETPSEPHKQIDASIASLRNSELRYRTMMAAAADAILIADMETATFLDSNVAASAMFGYSVAELRGMTGRMLAGEAGAASVDRMARDLIATGHALDLLHPLTRKDGTVLWADVRLTGFAFMGRRQYMAIIRDVTEQVERENELARAHRQLEESHRRVLHSGRLAALGQLAASVAHEINNPLQYVLARLDDLAEVVDDRVVGAVKDMRDGLERIRFTTRALLPFARVDGPAPEHVDLRDVVDWAVSVTANVIRHRARLEVKHGATHTVLGHRSGLGQLVTSLLTNAGHAIEEGEVERNRITVSTDTVEGRVRLIVEDTGCGMSKDVRDRAFEPFFTTKPRDVGIGLGLSLCAEITSRHGGTIEIESTVGVGTRVIVTLGELVETSAPPQVAPRVPAFSSARILVIDDEELILNGYRRQLSDLVVVTALGGQAAIELLAADSAFDAVICDVMMPDVDGLEVFERLVELAPHLQQRVIFCSGGAFTHRAREFLSGLSNTVLDKPVSRQELRSALEQLLGRPADSRL